MEEKQKIFLNNSIIMDKWTLQELSIRTVIDNTWQKMFAHK
jgi:hypothetical protein